jgi:5'-methylthioadenosine phosphorylase
MPKNYSKFNSEIAIIGGGNLFEIDFFKTGKLKNILTPYGRVNYYSINSNIFLNRHGPRKNIPPHRISHLANIFALKKLGVKFIFAFNSVGSLKKRIKPGEFLIPTDYIEFCPLTFYNQKREHIIPEISLKLRKILIKVLKRIKFKFHSEGIYFETKGPRLETKAEINLIKKFADVVGMTMGKEATLAKELGLEYASLCSIDNFAHGIIKRPLSLEEIEKNQQKNKKILERIIKEILKTKI